MDIKELQEELVEKILFIPIEDNRSSLERALEVINQLGKDYINNIITTSNGKFTALDYVIIADSQGDNPILSKRLRIKNRELEELETAIRNVGGKTSEELGIETNTYRAAPNDVNVIDNNGFTPLHYAARNGNLEIVRLLIEREANINVANNHEVTPLHFAARSGNLDIVRFLMERTSTHLEGVTVQSSIQGRGNHP